MLGYRPNSACEEVGMPRSDRTLVRRLAGGVVGVLTLSAATPAMATVPVVTVPLPAPWLLVSLGVAGAVIAAVARRRR
jgi:hypothetical protein